MQDAGSERSRPRLHFTSQRKISTSLVAWSQIIDIVPSGIYLALLPAALLRLLGHVCYLLGTGNSTKSSKRLFLALEASKTCAQ